MKKPIFVAEVLGERLSTILQLPSWKLKLRENEPQDSVSRLGKFEREVSNATGW